MLYDFILSFFSSGNILFFPLFSHCQSYSFFVAIVAGKIIVFHICVIAVATLPVML